MNYFHPSAPAPISSSIPTSQLYPQPHLQHQPPPQPAPPPQAPNPYLTSPHNTAHLLPTRVESPLSLETATTADMGDVSVADVGDVALPDLLKAINPQLESDWKLGAPDAYQALLNQVVGPAAPAPHQLHPQPHPQPVQPHAPVLSNPVQHVQPMPPQVPQPMLSYVPQPQPVAHIAARPQQVAMVTAPMGAGPMVTAPMGAAPMVSASMGAAPMVSAPRAPASMNDAPQSVAVVGGVPAVQRDAQRAPPHTVVMKDPVPMQLPVPHEEQPAQVAVTRAAAAAAAAAAGVSVAMRMRPADHGRTQPMDVGTAWVPKVEGGKRKKRSGRDSPRKANSQQGVSYGALKKEVGTMDMVMDRMEGGTEGEGEEVESKKAMRAERNRQSAAASRERKKHYIKELERRVGRLSKENAELQVEQLQVMKQSIATETKYTRAVNFQRLQIAKLKEEVAVLTPTPIVKEVTPKRNTWDSAVWQARNAKMNFATE